MRERLRHVREQIADAKLQRAELRATMIEPREGAKLARQMYAYVTRRMRRALRAATPVLDGTTGMISAQLRDVIHATLTDIVARRGKWPKTSK